MNEPVSWDPSLVKKFSSSNHFKLLNQLRNEVKKYPLNNKRKSTLSQNKDSNNDIANKQSDGNSQNGTIFNDSYKINDQSINQSNISFNNSKNFSIYNLPNNNYVRQDESQQIVQSKSSDESSSSSFKERLDQIDMK